jgi:predicted transcriptional regulator
MNEVEVNNKIIQIIKENNSNPKGITKTELARIFVERWGTSKNTIWEGIIDLIDSGKIELKIITKRQQTLFLGQ